MMNALRLPFAATSGVFVTLAVFALLWNLVSRPVDIGDSVPTVRFNFKPVIVETPIETKRPERVERELPPTIPDPPAITGIDGDTSPTTYVRLRTDTPTIPKGGGIVMSGSDRDAIPLVRFAPEYPPGPLADGTEGWVKVQFSITAAGTVKDAFVVESEPPKVFDRAALAAIERWRYNPKIEGGTAVERVGLQTLIRFDLE
jgi:protein TonB